MINSKIDMNRLKTLITLTKLTHTRLVAIEPGSFLKLTSIESTLTSIESNLKYYKTKRTKEKIIY